MAFETKSVITTFGGKLHKLSHQSKSTGTPMSVYVYLPPAAAHSTDLQKVQVPVLFYLSGLTCTPDNCSEKGFFHAAASRQGMALVWPDTSPRGASIQGEDESYDFGSGAGFYVDATKEPWSKNYKMESYISDELPSLLFADKEKGGFGDILDKNRVSITGHSMGGHGALTLFLNNPGKYKSVSAFSPIVNPTQCPWGQKAFSGYLGEEDKEAWKKYDATELIGKFKGDFHCLIDQGTADNFYTGKQLLTENFEAAAKAAGHDKGLVTRYQEGYDHSYWFISTFAEDHVKHAAKFLFA